MSCWLHQGLSAHLNSAESEKTCGLLVYYRVALLLEEQRLLSWSRRSGLSDERLDSRLLWAIIKEALWQLSELLCSIDTSSRRYKFKVEISHSSVASEDVSPYIRLGDDSSSFLLGGGN